MYSDLQSFIAKLRAEKEIIEVNAPCDAHLEIAEIHRRVIAAGGPALLFRNVKNKGFPVVLGLFGTAKRVDMAFGPRPENFIKTLASLPQELLPPSLGGLWAKRNFFVELLRVGFKKVGNAPVLEHEIPGAKLTALPAITSWPLDGGPFLTLPLVHTKWGHSQNLGMYRIQIYDDAQAGLHFQIGRGGGFHLAEAERAGVPLPVIIMLGGPPALILSAIAPLPENINELMLASLVVGKRLGRASLRDFPLSPVAESEFCIVGEAKPHVRRPEGPFGDHYGYYSLQHDYPVLDVKKIYHRKNAVFPATVVGKPRQEDFYIGDYLQKLLSPLFPLVMPTVSDLWSYGETGYHALSAAVIKERYGRETLVSVFRILGEGQLSLTKFLVCVDKPMDLKDFKSVLSYVLERADFTQDLYVFNHLSMDTLDYTSKKVNRGSKGVLIGIGEKKRELSHALPSLVASFIKEAFVFCRGCLVLAVEAYKNEDESAELISQTLALPELCDWPLVVLVDRIPRGGFDAPTFLWTTFTRFEPARDLYAKETVLRGHHPAYTPPILIDARMKPWYPAELFCDDETRHLVDKRWSEYFGGVKVEMGLSDEAHLHLEPVEKPPSATGGFSTGSL